jgi:hypothetical protein
MQPMQSWDVLPKPPGRRKEPENWPRHPEKKKSPALPESASGSMSRKSRFGSRRAEVNSRVFSSTLLPAPQLLAMIRVPSSNYLLTFLFCDISSYLDTLICSVNAIAFYC